MARTPLLNTLRCLFRDARTARANSMSLEALRERRAAHAERSQGTRYLSSRLPRECGCRYGCDPRPAIVVRGCRTNGCHRGRRHCRLELRARARRPRHQQHGVRSLGPHRRPHVQQHRLLERESGHRVVRRADRQRPYDDPEAGETLRPAARQPAWRPTPPVRRRLPLLRRLLSEEPGGSGFPRRLRHDRRRRRGGRLSHDV